MKKLIAVFFIAAVSLYAFAQEKTEAKVEIKTSSVCGMCKMTIEKGLKDEAGVNKAKLDLKTSVVTVFYDPSVTTPEKIRKAITLTGYDADDMKADPSAYEELHACCKKEH